MQSKSTVDNGWWWSNSSLGAPFALDELAYPSNSNVDQAIVWAISRVVRNASAAVNLTWIVVVVLSGVFATWCMRELGASTISSTVAGTLFALNPYALYRDIDHFGLVIYLVPFPCAAALLLASGRPPQRWYWKGAAVVVAGCALLAFNFVYYAFFGAFCIGVGALVGYLAHRDKRILAAGSMGIVVISACTFLNLAPSFYSWSRHGKPIVMLDKLPAESEIYGLKIRQLISPVFEHPFPPFRRWVVKEAAARFPIENENVTARLGLVGALGFLGLLALLFLPETILPRAPALLGASRLTLAAVLLSTVGGFGSLFNLFVSPDIRAYNRMLPFIEFFSLMAVALAVDSLFTTRRARIAAAVVVLAVGMGDQGQAARHLNVQYDTIAAEISGLDAFVRRLESALPDHAMIFQLPLRTYLNETGVARMMPYDHLKPYMVSRTLRFSYPASSNEQVRWQQTMSRLDLRQLTFRLAAEGFSAILVDRYGYPDNGDAATAAILRTVGDHRVIAETNRYVALNIRALADKREALSVDGPTDVAATVSMDACRGQTLMNVDQIGEARAPFRGGPVRVSGGSAFRVSGWAVDQSSQLAAGGVDVVIDETPFRSTYGADRRDVVDYFARPTYLESGFTLTIPADQVAKGPHTLRLRVISSGGTCYYRTASIPFIID
jgi:phosphoglycerol transferase